MIINELVTKLSFKQDKGLSNYQKSMMNAQRSTERAAKGMENAMGKSTSAIGKMMNFVMRVNGVHESKKNIDSVGASVRNVANELKMLVGGYAAVSAAQKAASFMFSATAEKETALTQLTTLVGKDKAGGIFKDLQRFAATTPYELKDVMEMFNRLEGAGFGMLDKAGRVQYDKLTSLGDLASASNKPLSELTDTILSANRGLGSMVDNFVGLSAKAEDGALAVTMFDRATGKTTTKKVQSGDKAGIMDFFTQAAQRQGIKGGMGELSKTLTGQMSTLTDSAKNLATTFSAGFIDKVHKLLEGTIKQLDKMEPQFKSMGAAAGKFINDMPRLFKEAQPYIEGCAAALAGMAFSYGVIKGLAVIKWLNDTVIAWRAMDAAMKVAAISGWAANAAVAWLPTMIAAAAAAVIWFGWQVYKYLTEGTDSLTWMNENFKWLADAIMLTGEVFKTWWPILEYIGKVLVGALIVAFNGLWMIIQFGWNKMIKPIFDKFIKSVSDIWNWIKSVTVESDNWRAGVMILWDGWKQFLNWLQPVLSWVSETMGGIGGSVKSWTDALSNVPGFGGGSSAASGGAGAAGLAATAINFVKSGQADKFAFSMSKNNGFLTKQLFQMGVACAQTVDQLLRMSGASKEVQDAMTASAPGSYSNLKNRGLAKSVSEKDLMPGDLVFYNPGGKGIQHVGVYVGNGQIVDASNSAGKQIGTGQRVIQRKNWMQGQAQYLRINSNQFSGQAATGPVTVNVNVGGSNASPKQIGNAAQNGTSKALTKAKQQQRKPTTVQG